MANRRLETDLRTRSFCSLASSAQPLRWTHGVLIVDILTRALYGPIWLSWITTLVGTALFGGLLFLLVRATKTLPISVRWCIRGACFGVIVLPLALWFYAQFFTDPIRALFLGFPGLLLLLHFAPFQDAGAVSHAIVENTAEGASSALRSVFLVGSVFWAALYGSIGFLVGSIIDWKRRHAADA
jgi:hypothetical protein